MFDPKKILVPTDFSEPADKAVEHAASLAEKYDARVVVLHVVEENLRECAIDYMVDYCLADDFVSTFEREIVKSSEERLQRMTARLRDDAKADVSFEIKKGSAADVILDEQVRTGADLIVMSSHGKPGSDKHSIGGVTDKVVRTAKCPVLIVRQ